MPGDRYVLGAGATGIAAAAATGWPAFEGKGRVGGLCATYERGGFRFEPGGGHWLFGLGGRALPFLEAHGDLGWHERRAAAYFPAAGRFVPYPVQAHGGLLPGAPPADPALAPPGTMKAWLLGRFGPDLCGRFFWPFNEAYTCGLHDRVAPQDARKNPLAGPGYNDRFAYPAGGLGPLLERAAAGLDARTGKAVRRIDLDARAVEFDDGGRLPYERLACTLPLDAACRMAGLPAGDPATGVVVANLGAEKGPGFPDWHWVYVVGEPFYRVGFYSNVDPDFAPPGKAALYVEGCAGMDAGQAVKRLGEWGWIGEELVVDVSHVQPAYTWRWRGSTWVEDSVARLAAAGVTMLGRYGRWRFQGVAASLEEGLGLEDD